MVFHRIRVKSDSYNNRKEEFYEYMLRKLDYPFKNDGEIVITNAGVVQKAEPHPY